MSSPTRLVIIDDHAVVLPLLAARLGAEPDFEVIAATADVEIGLEAVRAGQPDIVLLDPKRADGRGAELLKRVAEVKAGARVVVLTAYTSDWDRWGTHRSGADDYLLKDINTGNLLERLRALGGQPPAASD